MRLGFRELVFVLLLLAMPVATYFFVFQPRNAQIAEARKEVHAKQVKLEQLEAATMNISDLGKEIEKLSQAIDIFEQKLPAEREVEVVLKEVWELATKDKLTPCSVRTDKPIVGKLYSELPLQMTITGDFDGFYSFLLDLEKLKRITRMSKLTIEKLANDEGQMKATMVLSIFFDAKDQPPTAGKGQS